MIRGARRATGIAFGAMIVASGCAHSKRRPPDVAHDFARAVAAGAWQTAYDMMSTPYRQRVPLPKFRAEMGAELQAATADATAMSRLPVTSTRADLEMAGGDRIAMVLEGGAWKLETNVLLPFGQDTPRAALRTLIRAVDHKRYDILLRLVPARRGSRITVDALRAYWDGPEREPHRRVLELLRANVDAPIVNLGAEAMMPYGDSRRSPAQPEGEVHFLFEGGRWTVDDVE